MKAKKRTSMYAYFIRNPRHGFCYYETALFNLAASLDTFLEAFPL